MADGRIIIDTEVDSSGAEKGLDKTVKSARSQAATLAAEYKKQGMSSSEAFKKAWSEIERDSDDKSKATADNWKNNLSGKLGGLASSALATTAKVTAAVVTAASGAVAALATLSIKQYAQYEQLVGGVDTLFKDSSAEILNYANNAYKTAGMSANEYMSTITGFSASLLQGLGGDTKKAAEIGNQAVTDMSDNANKMGTSMESIQNAYQGFAKQNYTMLDNLKLGYGGTKTEMERLLADAGKLSGMEYNIGNFSDVIEAIHVVQSEMGITGTTALEASTTIEGSLNMTKSAWTNLLTGMADDNADFGGLVDNLISSAGALFDNLMPRIEIILANIGTALPSIIQKLGEALMVMLPIVLEAGVNVVASLGSGIIAALPTIIALGVDLITSLLNGIQNNLPTIISGAMGIITTLINGLVELLPQILKTGIDIIIQLALGLADTLPTLIPVAIDAILTLVETLLDNIDNIIDAGIKLIMALADGLIKSIPNIIDKVPTIISKLLNAIASNLPKLVEMGLMLIAQLAIGLIKAIPNLIMAVPKLIGGLLSAFGNYYSGFLDVGKNIVTGIWNGISGAAGWLMSKISGFADNVVGGIKGFFGIHSPSRVMRDLIGTNIVKGIGVGIDVETPNLEKDIDANMSDLVTKMQTTVAYETTSTSRGIVASNINSVANDSNNISDNLKDGDIFIIKNYMDSDEISEFTYKKVNGKLALATKKVR